MVLNTVLAFIDKLILYLYVALYACGIWVLIMLNIIAGKIFDFIITKVWRVFLRHATCLALLLIFQTVYFTYVVFILFMNQLLRRRRVRNINVGVRSVVYIPEPEVFLAVTIETPFNERERLYTFNI